MDNNYNGSGSGKSDTQIKILGWLLAVIIAGSLICFILGLIKAVVNTLVIIAGVLLAIALVIFFLYERGKWRYHTSVYEDRLKKLENNRNND